MDFSCPRNAWPRPCCQGNNVKLKNSFDGSDSTAGVMMIAMTKLLQARTHNFYLKNADILVAKSSFDLWPYRCHGLSSKILRIKWCHSKRNHFNRFPKEDLKVFFFQLWWILSPKKWSDLMAISSSSNHSVGTIWVYISIRAMVSLSIT